MVGSDSPFPAGMRGIAMAVWLVSYLVAVAWSWASFIRIGGDAPVKMVLFIGAGIPVVWGVLGGLVARRGGYFWRDLGVLLGASAVGYVIVANAALILTLPPMPECDTAPDPEQCEIGFGLGPFAVPATILLGIAGLVAGGCRAVILKLRHWSSRTTE